MLHRVLEPEVMDTVDDAADYDAMDHSTVNRRFVDDWDLGCRLFGLDPGAPLRMLDVGTGTARIPIEFCQRFPELQIEALDLASEMLKLGALNVERSGLGTRIKLQLVDAKRIPCEDGVYDTVVSNTIIHHIPEPLDSLAEMVRVLAPGGFLIIRDLLRLDNESEIESIVRTYAGNSTPSQQQLLRQSLHASLTITEVASMLEELQLPREWVQATSDRHWTICGRVGRK
jgi:ubiquinone/menaquinone biosynthesis C-methylase UbiE